MHKEIGQFNCVVCGKPFEFEAKYCCDGNACGCYGLPIDPPICSDECYEKAGYYKAARTTKEDKT